ncbi:DNA polymerase delta subunit 4 isoform X1 [Theropithecus gelada]|uniref:DNA polymerase delta subunit 4 isoform X1 n=1 Tax=Theropithecus gelada TaxID=9565 RepID=UPI000DC19534|nr:DNA polymerase delta subunit 4 isoform X1 [Theropithecus gelada]
MGRKRLITDSYPVVKRREGPAGHSKGELAPELGEEPQPRDEEEAELELLRQFDLAWQYGPCTGENPPSPTEVPLPASPVTHTSLKSPKRLRDSDPQALSPLNTHILQLRLYPTPNKAPESSSYPGRDHTAAALVSGQADGLGASPRGVGGAEDPPRRPPLPMQVRDRPGGLSGEPGPSPGTVTLLS